MSQQIEKPGYQRLQVTDQEHMTWANDKLNRKPYADRLTTLIKNTEGPYVIGLTSPWGSGKTFFLQAWHNQLVAEGKPCIYFNAWEMDASGEPLANLIAVCKQQADTFQSTTGRLKEKAKNAFGYLPTVVRGAGNLANYLGIPVGGAAEVSAKLIEKIQDILKEKDTFKRQLTELASEIATENNFPLFIIVDELDRCRPSYAIDLLESIKHLFNVPHVVFLLAVDSTQLLQQVEHTFGLKACIEDGKVVRDPRQDYLGKFFDIYYNLPVANEISFAEMLLMNDNKFSDYTKSIRLEKSTLKDILLYDLSKNIPSSIRDVVNRIELFLLFIKCNENLTVEEIIFSFWYIFNSNPLAITSEADIILKFTDDVIKDIKIISAEIEYDYENFIMSSNCLQDHIFCAYLYHKVGMIYNEELFLDMETTPNEIWKGYWGNQYHASNNIKHISEIAPLTINRIKCLEDFSSNLTA